MKVLKPVFLDPKSDNTFGVISIDERPKGDSLKFTLEPNGEPYVPSLNEIADYHDHQATWFPDGKDAQWHLQAAKRLRDIVDEQARTE